MTSPISTTDCGDRSDSPPDHRSRRACWMSMTSLPMFPLSSVLLLEQLLPLQIFEPRYRALLADCLDGDRRFGVVLIERGSEVGGGETRTDTGTVAEIIEHRPMPGGRVAVLALGTERIRVTDWLVDDPYPRATVQPWPDGAVDPADWRDALGVFDAARERLTDVYRLVEQQTGRPAQVPTGTAGAAEASGFTFNQAQRLPLAEVDRYRALAAPDPAARARVLAEAIRDAADVVEFRLRP